MLYKHVQADVLAQADDCHQQTWSRHTMVEQPGSEVHSPGCSPLVTYIRNIALLQIPRSDKFSLPTESLASYFYY